MTAKPRGPAAPAKPARSLLKSAHDAVFRHVHGGQLIYNACWEDPRIDRELMHLRADSEVVMITSAGCNALDYLLDGPAAIHAVDVNRRQNALLALKLALLRRGEFTDLFEFFGLGSHERHRAVYRAVRPSLPEEAREFWDRKIAFFDPKALKRSFYYHGTAGDVAWLLGGALFRANPGTKKLALCLLDAETLAQQREIYAMLEPKIWGKLNSWLVRQRLLMTLLGVPGPQVRLIEQGYPGGLTAYVQDKLRHVMTALPVSENYFWRVYMTGSYTFGCCPNYLRRENFAPLVERADRVHLHTCTISDFLRRSPGRYSHFVLLDHQDWLAWHDPAALLEEWELIFANSRPGAKVLLRSAALDLSFVPESVCARLKFSPALTTRLHRTDRVGTYGSLHFAEIK